MADWRQIYAEAKARAEAKLAAKSQVSQAQVQPKEIDTSLDPEERARLVDYINRRAPASFGEQAQDFGSGVISGATSVVPDLMSVVGANEPAEKVRQFTENIIPKSNPYRETVGAEVGGFVGGVLPFMAAGAGEIAEGSRLAAAAGKAIEGQLPKWALNATSKTGRMAILGGAQGFGAGRREADLSGATPGQSITAGLAQGAIGAAQALPVRAFQKAAAKPFMQSLPTVMGQNVGYATGGTVLSNLAKKAIYKPDQDVMQGVPEAALGATLGTPIIHAAHHAGDLNKQEGYKDQGVLRGSIKTGAPTDWKAPEDQNYIPFEAMDPHEQKAVEAAKTQGMWKGEVKYRQAANEGEATAAGLGRANNVSVIFVDGANGEALPQQGMYHHDSETGRSTILIDGSLNSVQKTKAVFWHEMTHWLQVNHPDVHQALLEHFGLSEGQMDLSDPRQLRRLVAERTGKPMIDVSDAEMRTEALNYLNEDLAGHLDRAFEDPTALEHVLQNPRTPIEKLGDAIMPLLQKLGIGGGSKQAQRAEALAREFAAGHSVHEGELERTTKDPQQSLRDALRISDAFRGVMNPEPLPEIPRHIPEGTKTEAVKPAAPVEAKPTTPVAVTPTKVDNQVDNKPVEAAAPKAPAPEKPKKKSAVVLEKERAAAANARMEEVQRKADEKQKQAEEAKTVAEQHDKAAIEHFRGRGGRVSGESLREHLGVSKARANAVIERLKRAGEIVPGPDANNHFYLKDMVPEKQAEKVVPKPAEVAPQEEVDPIKEAVAPAIDRNFAEAPEDGRAHLKEVAARALKHVVENKGWVSLPDIVDTLIPKEQNPEVKPDTRTKEEIDREELDNLTGQGGVPMEDRGTGYVSKTGAPDVGADQRGTEAGVMALSPKQREQFHETIRQVLDSLTHMGGSEHLQTAQEESGDFAGTVWYAPKGVLIRKGSGLVRRKLSERSRQARDEAAESGTSAQEALDRITDEVKAQLLRIQGNLDLATYGRTDEDAPEYTVTADKSALYVDNPKKIPPHVEDQLVTEGLDELTPRNYLTQDAAKRLQKELARLVQQGATEDDLTRALQERGLFFFSRQVMWHGSPHPAFSKWRNSAVGSGEGSAAFGWGVYMAQVRGVANTYRPRAQMPIVDEMRFVLPNGEKHSVQAFSHFSSNVDNPEALFNSDYSTRDAAYEAMSWSAGEHAKKYYSGGSYKFLNLNIPVAFLTRQAAGNVAKRVTEVRAELRQAGEFAELLKQHIENGTVADPIYFSRVADLSGLREHMSTIGEDVNGLSDNALLRRAREVMKYKMAAAQEISNTLDRSNTDVDSDAYRLRWKQYIRHSRAADAIIGHTSVLVPSEERLNAIKKDIHNYSRELEYHRDVLRELRNIRKEGGELDTAATFPKAVRPGHMAELSIETDNYLKWDFGIDKQPQELLEKLKRIVVPGTGDSLYEAWKKHAVSHYSDLVHGATWQDMYERFSNAFGGERNLSLTLDQHGIEGHMYADRMSRPDPSDPDATFNAVMYNGEKHWNPDAWHFSKAREWRELFRERKSMRKKSAELARTSAYIGHGISLEINGKDLFFDILPNNVDMGVRRHVEMVMEKFEQLRDRGGLEERSMPIKELVETSIQHLRDEHDSMLNGDVDPRTLDKAEKIILDAIGDGSGVKEYLVPVAGMHEAMRSEDDKVHDQNAADEWERESRTGVPYEGMWPDDTGDNVHGLGFDTQSPGHFSRALMGEKYFIDDEARHQAIHRLLVDEYSHPRRVFKSIVKQGGQMDDRSDVDAHITAAPGRARHQMDLMDRDYREPIVNEARKAKIKIEGWDDKDPTKNISAGAYLYALHAPDRNTYMMRTQPKEKQGKLYDREENPGSGMSDSMAKAIVDAAHASPQADSYRKIAEINRALQNRRLELEVEYGRLTQHDADTWRANFGKDYVPLRDIDAQSPFSVAAFRAKGRSGLAEELIAHSLEQMSNTIIWGERNRVYQSAAAFVLMNKDAGLWHVFSDEAKLPKGAKEEAIQYYKNGRKKFLLFNDRRISEALKREGVYKADVITKTIGRLSQVYSRLNTAWNPEFLFPNLIRDLQDAKLNLSSDGQRKIVKNLTKNAWKASRAMWNVLRDPHAKGTWEDMARRFKEAGGETGWAYTEDVEVLAKRLHKEVGEVDYHSLDPRHLKTVLKKSFDFLDRANGALENGTRLAVFKGCIEARMSDLQAAKIAKTATVDFNRRGEATPLLNALFTFFNANVQGTVRTFSGFHKSPKKMAFAAALTASAIQIGLLNRFLSDVDDDGVSFWDKKSDWEKTRNLVIMLPGQKGRSIDIPLPWGWGLFSVLGTKIDSAIHGRMTKGEFLGGMASAATDAFSPLGSTPPLNSPEGIAQLITPTLLRPITQIASNVDYAGRPIAPAKNPFEHPAKPNSERFFSTVSPAALGMARYINELSGGSLVKPGAVDISPEWIELMSGQVFGGLGMAGTKFFKTVENTYHGSFKLDDLPLARRFTRSIDVERQAQADYYKDLNDAALAKKEVKELHSEEARTSKEFRGALGIEQANRRVMALKKQLSKTTNEEQRARIQDQINRTMKLAHARFTSIK